MYQLPTAPQSIGGILDDGFRLFRASWRQLLPVALVASLLGALPQLLIRQLGLIKPAEVPTGFALGAGTITTMLAIFLLTMVSYTILLAGVHRVASTGTPSLREAIALGVRRTPAAIGAGFVASLAIAGGFILLVIPGLYLMIALYPVFMLPVAEGLGPLASVKRAYALVKGSWWRTAWVLTVLTLLLVALFGIVSVLSGLATIPFIDSKNSEAGLDAALATQFVVTLVLAPLLPLTYCIMYSVYTDLRLRKDGGDLLERVAAAQT
jgi:hypothetical protein